MLQSFIYCEVDMAISLKVKKGNFFDTFQTAVSPLNLYNFHATWGNKHY